VCRECNAVFVGGPRRRKCDECQKEAHRIADRERNRRIQADPVLAEARRVKKRIRDRRRYDPVRARYYNRRRSLLRAEEQRERARLYYAEHAETLKAKRRERYQKNREKVLEYQREYDRRMRDANYHREYRARRKERGTAGGGVKVRAWIRTGKVGSEVSHVINIPDEDVEDLRDIDRDEVIGSYVNNWMWNHAEWGWTIVDEGA
jgi:hypothetical protein